MGEDAGMTYPCPACGAPASLDSGCAACGAAPDPVAAEVIQLDGRLRVLSVAVHEAWTVYNGRAREAEALRRRRDELASQVRLARAFAIIGADRPKPPPVPPVPSSVPPRPGAGAVPDPAPVSPAPETSTLTVQNVLFTVGGLLLGA